MSGWAVCPACSSVVVDEVAHGAWHNDLTRAAVFATGATVPDAVDGEKWSGVPVLPAPEAPTDSEAGNAAVLRARAAEVFASYPAAMGALDAYLAVQSPTAGQVAAQVRTLTTVTRGVLIAIKAVARLMSRALDSTD